MQRIMNIKLWRWQGGDQGMIKKLSFCRCDNIISIDLDVAVCLFDLWFWGTQAEFSKKLFRSSFLTLASIGAAWYFQQYDCCFLAVSVLVASLNYWRHSVKVLNSSHKNRERNEMSAFFMKFPHLPYSLEWWPFSRCEPLNIHSNM